MTIDEKVDIYFDATDNASMFVGNDIRNITDSSIESVVEDEDDASADYRQDSGLFDFEKNKTSLKEQLKMMMKVVSKGSIGLLEETEALRIYIRDLEGLLDSQEKDLEIARRSLEVEVKDKWKSQVYFEAKIEELEDQVQLLKKKQQPAVISTSKNSTRAGSLKQPGNLKYESLVAENQLLKEMLEFSQKNLSKLSKASK